MTHRSFIAVIVAAALAVTGLTGTPARAGNDDVAKWIAGAVALGLLGAAISEENKRDRRRDQAVTRHQPKAFGHAGQAPRFYGHTGNTRSHVVKRADRRLLPRSCRVRLRTARGDIPGFGRRCLLRSYAHFNALPHACARRADGHRGRVIYAAPCLRRHGFGVAAY